MADSKSDSDFKAEAKEVFDYYDADNSGFIDEVELSLVCSSLGENLDKNKLAAIFKTLDKTGNGKISFDDFYSWWSTDLGSTGNVVASMRAKLLMSKGLKFLNEVFHKKQEDLKTNDNPLTFELHGPVDTPKMGVTVSIDTNDTISSSSNIAIGMTYKLSKPDAAKFVCEVSNLIFDTVSIVLQQQGSFPFTAKVNDNKDGTVTCVLELQGGSRAADGAVFLEALNNFHAGFSFGWSWESLIKDQFTMKTLDLANFQAFVDAAKIPMFSDMVGPVAAGLETALEAARSAIPFNGTVQGLDSLKQGDASAKLNTTALVDELFEFAKAQAPFPIDNLFDVVTAVSSHSQQQQQFKVPAALGVAVSKFFRGIFARDVSGVLSLEVRFKGGQGVKVEFNNFLDFGSIFNAAVSGNETLAAKEAAGTSA